MAFAASTLPGWAVELVIVEQAGCHYCELWNTQIAPIYPKTPEGAYAPLHRVSLRGDGLKSIDVARRINFTPTFILVDDNRAEIIRLEGYPGEDFFWGMLDRMLLEKTDYEHPPKTGG